MPLPTVRLATNQDVPAMLAIYAPYVENTHISFETQVPALQEFARRFADITAVFPWLVCEKDGAVIGYAYATRFGARHGYDWSAETSIYLATTAYGQGAGRMLYKALCALAAMQGYYTLYARIVTPNTQSEGFHTACGFEKEAQLENVGCKFGRFLGIAYYKKCLHPYGANPPAPLPLPQLAQNQVQAVLAEVNSTPTSL